MLLLLLFWFSKIEKKIVKINLDAIHEILRYVYVSVSRVNSELSLLTTEIYSAFLKPNKN